MTVTVDTLVPTLMSPPQSVSHASSSSTAASLRPVWFRPVVLQQQKQKEQPTHSSKHEIRVQPKVSVKPPTPPFPIAGSHPESSKNATISSIRGQPPATWGREAYAYDRRFADPKTLLGVSPNSLSTSTNTNSSTKALITPRTTLANRPSSVSASAPTPKLSPNSAWSWPNTVQPSAIEDIVGAGEQQLWPSRSQVAAATSPTARAKIQLHGGRAEYVLKLSTVVESPSSSAVRAALSAASTVEGPMAMSPRTALREASRRERLQWQEQHHLIKKIEQHTLAEDAASLATMSGLQKRMAHRSTAVATSGNALVFKASLSTVTQSEKTPSDSVWTSAKTTTTGVRWRSELNALALALVMHLWVSSAFLTARDEMAFVSKTRSMVELGHGETRAFVCLA